MRIKIYDFLTNTIISPSCVVIIHSSSSPWAMFKTWATASGMVARRLGDPGRTWKALDFTVW